MQKKLSQQILMELFNVMIGEKDVLEAVVPHLDYPYLPTEEFKSIYKIIRNEFELKNNLISYGVIAEKLDKEDAKTLLTDIKNIDVLESKDSVIDHFEEFIKKSKFVSLNKKIAELWADNKEEDAITLNANESKIINEFSLRGGQYSRLFQDFDKRQERRQNEEAIPQKVPTGVAQFDHLTGGGVEKGTALLGIARSGVGKSTILKWFGYSAAKRRYRGVHFQAEGKREQAEDNYDAIWTGTKVHEMKLGKLAPEKIDAIRKIQNEMLINRSEIFIVTYDQFDSATIAQCRQTIKEIEKEFGPLDFGIWDYLELFDPGDGKRYAASAEGERFRKIATARKIVNVCVEFDLAGFVVTQASNIPKGNAKEAGWNNPDFVLTREHISNLKAAIDPFSYCITLNQTEDENDLDLMRIWIEKFREYKLYGPTRLINIFQSRDVGRFVDVRKTNNVFWDPIDKKPIDNGVSYSELMYVLKEQDDEIDEG